MMPLHVDIRINETMITQLHIGRKDALLRNDQVSTYTVVKGAYDPWSVPWDLGVDFTHKYDDGAEVCVQKALAALLPSD